MSPLTVTCISEVAAAFCGTNAEAVGASKLKTDTPVPATAATVTWTKPRFNCEYTELIHETEVVEDQLFVRHSIELNPLLAVCSAAPKLKPVTVTDACPLCGAFRSTWEATGPSNDSTALAVPVMAATVIIELVRPTTLRLLLLHTIEVVEDQAAVTQALMLSEAVAVSSWLAKLSPARVTDACPEWGMLRPAWDASAASKLKTSTPVPATAATVTAAAVSR